MADKAWKALERTVAQILGGVRSWNSEDAIDVLVPGDNPVWAVEVKNLRSVTIADCERILQHNQAKADQRDPPLKSALVVKRKAGTGRKTPMLLVIDLSHFAQAVEHFVHEGND